MLLRIDPLAAEPIFEQITFQVKAAVARGEVAGGDRLPSVRELAKDLAINPNTVARAYDQLEAQGVIVRRQGSGCFVTGETSGLELSQRKKRLDELIQRTITEAHHLGFDGDHLRAALERRLKADLATERKS
jgi:GntR family transcriptional regulator